MVVGWGLLRQFVRNVAICAAILVSASAADAQSGPFSSLAGVWSGNGTITLDDGSKERIRCRATYAVSNEGSGLNQSLLCASDSYKFELRSNVLARNGALSGNWTETTRNVSGTLEGRASNGQFNVVVSAPVFTARLTLTTNGNKQTVAIAADGQFKGATISLTRS